MSRFQQYLDGLPRTPSQLYRKQPYIIDETSARTGCLECEKPRVTRTLTVYVPSVKELVEFNFHEPNSENPEICGLKETLPGDPLRNLELIASEIQLEGLKRLALELFSRLPPLMDVDAPIDPWLF